jgi:hypothetical protein
MSVHDGQRLLANKGARGNEVVYVGEARCRPDLHTPTYDAVIMDRRTFISSVAGGFLAVSPASHAQKSAMPMIGFLHGESPEGYAHHDASFRQDLNETGYVARREPGRTASATREPLLSRRSFLPRFFVFADQRDTARLAVTQRFLFVRGREALFRAIAAA